MILWHIATAVGAVAWVFGDPRFDFRLLVVGALVPMLDAVTGGASVMHTLVFSVALVIVVMLATIGRGALRRRLLALPIGTMLYLLFSGAWNDGDTFWWPFGGGGLGMRSMPFVARPWSLTVLLEVAGVAAVVWGWRRAGLGDAGRRHAFVAGGRLDLW